MNTESIAKVLNEQRESELKARRDNVARLKEKLEKEEAILQSLQDTPLPELEYSHEVLVGYWALGKLFYEMSDSLDGTLSNLDERSIRLNSNSHRYTIESAAVLFQFGEVFSEFEHAQELLDALTNEAFVDELLTIDIAQQFPAIFKTVATVYNLLKKQRPMPDVITSPFVRCLTPGNSISNSVDSVCEAFSHIEYAVNAKGEFIGLRATIAPLDQNEVVPVFSFIGEGLDADDEDDEDDEDEDDEEEEQEQQ